MYIRKIKDKEYRFLEYGLVSIVASINLPVGSWAAYIGKGSWNNVISWGTKMDEETANKIFPEAGEEYYYNK